MKLIAIITASLIAAAAAILGIRLVQKKEAKPAPQYAASLTSLQWDNGDYIRWTGNQSSFPARKDNLSGMIIIIEPNGNEVAVEYIRPGYTRQHLKNARGKDEHALKTTKPGQTVQVYLCALHPNHRPDKTIRTNPMPLIWR